MLCVHDIKITYTRMTRNLDVALLRTFVTASDHASMTAAGNALHLTQSAVSQQIARLEDLTGPLFLRQHRRLRLTTLGERLITKARRLIALNDELWSEMTPAALRAPVRLGAPQDLVATWLPSILKSFSQAHPLVEIALVCMASPDLLDAVTKGSVDLALIEEPAGPTKGTCLIVDRLVWVGARGGSAHMKMPLPVSLVAETCVFRRIVLDALDAHGVVWRTLYDSGSIDATSATVRADLAVATWLASTVPEDLVVLSAGVELPALPRFGVNLHRPKGGSTPTAAELEQHLRQSVGAMNDTMTSRRVSGPVHSRVA